MAVGRFDLQGRTPYEVVMHYTSDITEYVSFTWFQWCWFYDKGSKTKQLGRWLGPAHQTGQSFFYYIIKLNGQYLARSTAISIPEDKLQMDDLKERTSIFMNCLKKMIGNAKQPSFNIQNAQEIYYSSFGDETNNDDNNLPYGIKLRDMETTEINEPYLESLDEYINAQVVIPNQQGIPVLAKVKKQKRHHEGQPIGEQKKPYFRLVHL